MNKEPNYMHNKTLVRASERLPKLGLHHAYYNGDTVIFHVHDGGFRVTNYHGEHNDAPNLNLVKWVDYESPTPSTVSDQEAAILAYPDIENNDIDFMTYDQYIMAQHAQLAARKAYALALSHARGNETGNEEALKNLDEVDKILYDNQEFEMSDKLRIVRKHLYRSGNEGVLVEALRKVSEIVDDPTCSFALKEIDVVVMNALATYKKDGWISVEERLPEVSTAKDMKPVQVFTTTIGQTVAHYWGHNGDPCKGWSIACVTHWRPLPQPPSNE